jgi:primosomal protein N' (replication factor Y)
MSIQAAHSQNTFRLSEASLSAGQHWVEVLVDCPGAQGLYTYQVPPELTVQPGDILSVPFGSQQVGAIAIDCPTQLPEGLELAQVRAVDAIVHAGFFSPRYWSLLKQVAAYYGTSLMAVIRVALPPGLLARSQRRIRLAEPSAGGNHPSPPLPAPNSQSLSPSAQHLLSLLQSSKTGNYSWQHLQRQVPGAYRGLQELLKAGWVESYLEAPTPVRPKQRQAVTLTSQPFALDDLSARQQEILQVLKRQGGERWLTDVLQECQTSSATLKSLARKGYLTIQPQEVLRSDASGAIVADTPKSLTPDQSAVLEQLLALRGFNQVLLHGVTGSGKTEIYLQAIAPLLQQGKSALVLVPEIGLTPQLTDRFRARFGTQVCVYHSALSDGERYDTWRQLLKGDSQVVIGTRSAIFVPLTNLGLIILDEEHDSSFKQDQPAPCYHARTVAQWRAELENCPLLLGSATPSLESWVLCHDQSTIHNPQSTIDSEPFNSKFKIQNSKFLSLPTRVHDRPLPRIQVIDMRQELAQGNRSIFSQTLQQALQTLQEERQQGILFVPRRGHSTFVSCRSCGYVMTCPHCDVSLTYHQPVAGSRPTLRCHYCNYQQSQPDRCPCCDSLYFKHFGSGTQRVVQELAQEFPELRILRFDSDTTRTKGAHRSLLTRFAQGEADLLVGTQMLTKGIDLPQVTLVGIVAADGLLHFSDYRASERTFQILTQVAGRSGRGDRAGQVLLQTYSPDHPVIKAVQQQDYAAFVTTELQQRQALCYPPYSQLLLFRLSSENPVAVQQTADRIAQFLAPLEAMGVERLGPAPATILRVARRYRWQILLKFPLASTPEAVSRVDLAQVRSLCPSNVSLTLDVDPLTIG